MSPLISLFSPPTSLTLVRNNLLPFVLFRSAPTRYPRWILPTFYTQRIKKVLRNFQYQNWPKILRKSSTRRINNFLIKKSVYIFSSDFCPQKQNSHEPIHSVTITNSNSSLSFWSPPPQSLPLPRDSGLEIPQFFHLCCNLE